MNRTKENIIDNVFIPAGENKLQLCSIHFNNKFTKIIPTVESLFEWNDIKEPEALAGLKNSIPVQTEIVPNSIDGNFLLAIPGGIDPHVHFNTPGYTERDTFQEASLAAAYGGVTTIIDMPCTSKPPVTTLVNYRVKQEAVKGKCHVDYAFWSGIRDNNAELQRISQSINELADNGTAGFKVYMASGMNTFKELSDEQILSAAKIIRRTHKPLAVHAEDKIRISGIQDKSIQDGDTSWQAYCRARDIAAETDAVKRLIQIAENVDCRIHVVHLSSGAALSLIRDAQSRGLTITAETCPHYLYFTQNDFNNDAIRNYLKTAPPVKFEEDREALWSGLADGTIIFTTTDHAGCDPAKEKVSNNFFDIYGGIPGVEHRVPFLLSEGFLKGRISLAKTVSLLSTGAADYFNIKDKGYIKENFDADFALVDLWNFMDVDSSQMHSKGKYTPFEGVRFNARVEKTFLRGNLIMDRSFSSSDLNLSPEKQLYGKFINV